MSLRNLTLHGALPFVLLAALACGGGHSPSEPTSPPTADTLTLVRVDPATSTALRQGAAVTIRARLRYAMARSTQGVIFGFVIASGPSGPAPVPTPGFTFALAFGSRGEIEVPLDFRVPANATSVEVHYALDPDTPNNQPQDDTDVTLSYSAQP
jgi:hypothetical protein